MPNGILATLNGFVLTAGASLAASAAVPTTGTISVKVVDDVTAGMTAAA